MVRGDGMAANVTRTSGTIRSPSLSIPDLVTWPRPPLDFLPYLQHIAHAPDSGPLWLLFPVSGALPSATCRAAHPVASIWFTF